MSDFYIESVAMRSLNDIEHLILAYTLCESTFVNVDHREDFFSDWFASEYLDFEGEDIEYFRRAYDIISDTLPVIDDAERYKELDLVYRYLKARFDWVDYDDNSIINQTIDSLTEDYDLRDQYMDILYDEIFSQPIFSLVSEYKIIEVIDEIMNNVYDSLLTKKEYKKMIKQEKRNISENVALAKSINDLSLVKEVPIKKSKQTEKKCYIMKNCRNGFYKIGNSSSPEKREKTLQAEEPEIKIIKVFRQNHESDLHQRYANQRKRGEWFDLTDVQLKYICTHYE